jgi:hypothetical protein
MNREEFEKVVQAHSEKLLQVDSIRYDLVLIIRLPTPVEGDKIRVERQDTCIVQNLTDQETVIHPRMDYYEEQMTVDRLRIWDSFDQSSLLFDKRGQDLRIPCDRPGIARSGIEIEKGISLGPIGRLNSAALVEWQYHTIDDFESSAYISIGKLSCGLTVQVSHDSQFWEVRIDSLNDPTEVAPGLYTFDKNQLWFPEQHLQVWWKPKERK